LPSSASAAFGVAVSIVVYTTVNAGLIFIGIYLAIRPDKPLALLGSWSDYALEFATLCMAGLAALAVQHQPWLTLLVLPPMVVLQRSVLIKQLEIAATTDSKTGLLNALTWKQLAERELERAKREKQSSAMLIIDMDNFKFTNDNFGHLVGDAVLKAVATALTEELRAYDTLGRFGGEEFVALLADADAMTALGVADRILKRIRKLEVPTHGLGAAPVTGLSASIGIACYPQQGDEVEELLRAADSALYTAKNAGRDRVELVAKSP
jgi:diguanylate cyclase (GGDEF)-like protein